MYLHVNLIVPSPLGESNLLYIKSDNKFGKNDLNIYIHIFIYLRVRLYMYIKICYLSSKCMTPPGDFKTSEILSCKEHSRRDLKLPRYLRVYVYMCVCAHLYARKRILPCESKYIYEYKYVCTYIHTYVNMYDNMYTCIHVFRYTCIYIHLHI
jgi:hypothetical protein